MACGYKIGGYREIMSCGSALSLVKHRDWWLWMRFLPTLRSQFSKRLLMRNRNPSVYHLSLTFQHIHLWLGRCVREIEQPPSGISLFLAIFSRTRRRRFHGKESSILEEISLFQRFIQEMDIRAGTITWTRPSAPQINSWKPLAEES
jgi:hypothetical protein